MDAFDRQLQQIQQRLAKVRAEIQRMQGRLSQRRPWTEAEKDRLRREYSDTHTLELAEMMGRPASSVSYMAGRLGLKKSLQYMRTEHAPRLARSGESYRFQPGQAAWNKGMRGLDLGGKETQFKAGNRPETWVPVGTEVVDKDGYVKRKVRDDAPAGHSRHNWKYVHRIVWEEANGAIPKGHAVGFKPGADRQNPRLQDLELVSRQELARRNSIHRYPPEVKDLIRLNGKLRRTIEKRKRQREEQDQ